MTDLAFDPLTSILSPTLLPDELVRRCMIEWYHGVTSERAPFERSFNDFLAANEFASDFLLDPDAVWHLDSTVKGVRVRQLRQMSRALGRKGPVCSLRSR
jgi:hypothetical protein